MRTLKILSILFLSLAVWSCSEDEEVTGEFDGSIASLEQFYTPELVQALEDLGFIINEGGSPPNIEGSYFISPFILQASTVNGDIVGQSFADYTTSFSNQNNEELIIDFNGSGGTQIDEGFGSFISGDNNQFSVFLKTTTQINGSIMADSALAISGTITPDGIEDFQYAILMLDDKGDPDGVYIENNTGRLLYDSDGFSPKN